MILITKLNNKEEYINPHLIEVLESNPDTTITFLTGRVLVVKETVKKVIERIIQYRRLIGIEIGEKEAK